MKLSLLTSSLALLGLTTALPQQYKSVDVPAKATRIMPFGASIVEITCWRAFLWKKLHDAGKTNLDFVGSRSGPSSCTLNGVDVPFDKDNEGHSGALATDYAANHNLTGWLAAAAPVDMIIMHLGTNDCVKNVPIANTIKAYDVLLGEMHASNPNMKIVVSTLIPISPKNFGQSVSDCITALNVEVRKWIKAKNLIMVENETGFDYNSMTSEGEHPNEKGSVFMADKFFEVVKGLL